MGEQIQGLLADLCLSQRRLAGELGVGYDTVRGWASGRAEPTPANGAALAVFMRRHAERLQALADELEE